MLLLLSLLLLLRPPHWSAAAAAPRCAASTYHNCMTLATQDASLAWTYHPRNATLDVSFTGAFISPSGWVAVGINPNSPEMTGTRALVSFPDPSTGALILLPFILDPSVKLQRSPLTSRPLDLPLLSSSSLLTAAPSVRDGAKVQIRATLKLKPNRTRIHLVWNRGLYVQGYSPTIHPTGDADLASRATIDIVSNAATAATEAPTWLRPLHGVLNSFAWGLCLPVGVVVARYLRQCESVGPTWFYAHAAVQAVGIVVGFLGFGIGLVLGAASTGVTYGLHRGLGVAAVCMAATQAAAVIMRPAATHRYRKYWKSYHHLVGYGCAVVGAVNVFEGFEVMGMGRSYVKLGYCTVLAALLGVCVALEANAWVLFCRKAEEERMRREGVVEEGMKRRVSF